MQESNPGLSPKILVVDDEADLLELYAKRLQRAKFEVVTATGGSQAIEYLKSDSFDVILCDINMPGDKNGFEVFDFVRQETGANQAFIFVTGHGEGTPEMTRALSLGADGIYSKPISSKVLIDHIRKIVDKKKNAA